MGGTPFNAAVQNGHLEAVKYLMTQGAKLNIYNWNDPTLFAAAQSGHLGHRQILYWSKGADVNVGRLTKGKFLFTVLLLEATWKSWNISFSKDLM